jgi:hypothetical protein
MIKIDPVYATHAPSRQKKAIIVFLRHLHYYHESFIYGIDQDAELSLEQVKTVREQQNFSQSRTQTDQIIHSQTLK